MKSKKFIFLFLGLLLLLTLSGCNDIFKSYSITYYVDGDKVSLGPAYYFPGREVKLPTSEDLPAIPNWEFSGWYDNAEYEGEIITVIATTEASDKVFYGKYSSTGTVDPEQPGNPDPEQPGNPDPEQPEQPLSSSIKDVYSKTVGDKVTVEGVITGIYGNNFYINDGVKGVLVYLGNETKYASTVKLGANVVVEGSVDIYKDIHQIKTITSLKTSNKTYKATSIKLTNVSQDELKKYPNDLVNLEGVSVSDLGTYESGKDYTVKLTLNGVTVDLFMSRHVAESAKTKVLEVLESLADTDTLNINGLHVSKYNSYQLVITDATSLVKVASSTPDTPVDPEEPEQPSSSLIKDAYSKTVGDKVTVEGVITGIYGNNFYINDGVKGILVYLGNETKYASIVKLGANVVVEGSVDIYKDIHQIKTITSLKTSNKTYKATSIKLTNVSQDELKKYPNDLVNLEGVSVSNLGTYESGKDYTVKLTLNGVTVDLFMSRHVAEGTKTKVLEVLESLTDTDTLNINGLHVSKYNSYQLVITDAAKLEVVSAPVDPSIPTYSVVISCNDSEGTFTINGTKDKYGKYYGNITITIKANRGYLFEKLTDSKTGTTLSTNATYTISNIDRDYSLTVYFEKDENASGTLDFLYSGTYYSGIDLTLTGSALKFELRDLITSTHSKKTSYNDLKTAYAKSDKDPNKSGNMILFYSGLSVKASWDGAATWNREHMWPQSKGWFSTSGAGSDLHHIRPTDTDVNNRRGSLPFGEVSGGTEVLASCHGNASTGCYIGGGYFEPADRVKGDTARIIFYLLTRYSESDSYSITQVAQSMDMLLRWNELDPVDDWEYTRNEETAKIQGNRNPFIDCSGLAEVIWG